MSFNVVNIRDFTTDKHRVTDDESFGGGPGMVMKVEPIDRALNKVVNSVRCTVDKRRIVLLSPQGQKLTQEKAKELASYDQVVLICGRYEGVDERVHNLVDEEISIGDYVLTGGEIPAMVLVDAVSRMLPGVVGDSASAQGDSFYADILDYAHYTRPAQYQGWSVPAELLSGDHAEVGRIRRKEALSRTFFRRPELLTKATLSGEDKALLGQIIRGN